MVLTVWSHDLNASIVSEFSKGVSDISKKIKHNLILAYPFLSLYGPTCTMIQLYSVGNTSYWQSIVHAD